jgi:hypothetical protein
VFSKRRRSGRNKRTSDSDQFGFFQKCQELPAPELPGLGVFSLSTPLSVAENAFSPLDFNSLEFLYPDQSFQLAPDFLFDVPHASTTASSDPDSDRSEKNTAMEDGNSLSDVPIDLTSFLPLVPSRDGVSLPVTDADLTREMRDSMADGDTPDPMTDLATLLTEIRQYEGQIAQLSGLVHETFEDYPIGEALFLSQRFCSVLSNCNHHSFLRQAVSSSSSSSPSSTPCEQNLPFMLLALSCYLTLARVHQSVFEHMHNHLSQITGLGPRTDTSSINPQAIPITSISSPNSLEADMHAYRGLQLSQLQPANTEWELARRTKKAVGMLLGLLGHVEKALGLPPDVRIATTDPNTSLSINFPGRNTRMQSF